MTMNIHPILSQYCKLVDFLGAALGPDYEVALHDLTKGNYSIVAIANGFNSGRKIGAPLTSKALGFIESGIYKTENAIIGYPGKTPQQISTRSSTMFIKDEEDELIGMLCINYNMERCNQTLQKVLELCNLPLTDMSLPVNSINDTCHTASDATTDCIQHTAVEQPEIFSGSVSELIDIILEHTLEPGTSPDRLHQHEKIQIITRLKDRGVFSVKGAVREVAAKLCCSEPTIYRYLKNT